MNSFPKTVGGRYGKDIHEIAMVDFPSRLNNGSHINVWIGYVQ